MMVRTLPLSLLMTSGLAALSACGDDEGGSGDATATVSATDADTSAGSATMTGPDTMTESDTMTTVDTTDSDSMTTVDTMTTDDSMTTVDPDTSTGDVPAGTGAFRLNTVAVRDPHLFATVIGIEMDITEANVNEPLTAALMMDGDEETPADGFYDLGFVLAFDPLDQSDGGGGALIFANAQCAAEADPSNCNLLPTTMEFPTTYTSQAMGTCQEANPANLPPNYDPAPGVTTSPCFVSVGAPVTIATSSFALPMENASVAARYVGDPAGNLVEGTLIGFVSNEAADAAILAKDLPVVGGMPLSAVLREEDRDDNMSGWWFHIDFTAVPANWNG